MKFNNELELCIEMKNKSYDEYHKLLEKLKEVPITRDKKRAYADEIKNRILDSGVDIKTLSHILVLVATYDGEIRANESAFLFPYIKEILGNINNNFLTLEILKEEFQKEKEELLDELDAEINLIGKKDYNIKLDIAFLCMICCSIDIAISNEEEKLIIRIIDDEKYDIIDLVMSEFSKITFAKEKASELEKDIVNSLYGKIYNPEAFVIEFAILAASLNGDINVSKRDLLEDYLYRYIGDELTISNMKNLNRIMKKKIDNLSIYVKNVVNLLDDFDYRIKIELLLLALIIVTRDKKITKKEEKFLQSII